MTNAARIYALLLATVVFFLAWATVAAHPWQTTAPDPRVAALAQRRTALQREAIVVQRVVARRWTAYRVALARRQALNAAQPVSVTVPAPLPAAAPPVVSAPPATSTHTS
jgi:hypothetical protein